jgi:hypothetical protein
MHEAMHQQVFIGSKSQVLNLSNRCQENDKKGHDPATCLLIYFQMLTDM